ncbi:MAG TPA: rod-binding protein [Acetobacteraceae bacterium]|nr:rod-binding protein [Acetobacteraceae bacterium]
MHAAVPLAPSGPPADADRTARTREAAKRFEAMAIGEMLKPMFDTLDTSGGPFGGGAGEAAWRPMLVETIGEQMARHGGIGLADAIFRALMQRQEASP